MRNEMTMQAPRQMNLMQRDRGESRTLLERLAAWADALTQQAHAEVRCYEAACARLGDGTNPRETAHDADRAARMMLYGNYFAESIEGA